ncbi:hypothetical protein ACFY8X_38975 [Streptomyces tanashiensis]|uniref:hypothetical protein n=1 Tax=Streptomyces tanashiensis TaxID=67367 RepID=UPI0036E4CFEA
MADPDIRQVLVHPAVWPYLELWLAAHNLVLAQVPVEDDLPTYAMVTADAGDAGKVLAAGIRDAARQASGQQPDSEPNVADATAMLHRMHADAGLPAPAAGLSDTQPANDEVVLPSTAELSYRLEHRPDSETAWRKGKPGTGLRWTYADRTKAGQRLAEAREQWPQYEHRMVTITTTVAETVTVEEDETR